MKHRQKRSTQAGMPEPGKGADSVMRPKSSVSLAWCITLLGLASLAAIVFWRFRSSEQGRTPAAAPVDTMAITVAYTEATRLVQSRHFMASLPYYHRVGQLLPQPAREYELLVAFALRQASLESRDDAAQPISRSSVERIAFLREALDRLERAQRLSATPREIAEVRLTRAKVLHIGGLPWETLLELRAAEVADPSWDEVAGLGSMYAFYLHHPESPLPGGGGDDLLGR